jgi:RNA polymerase sigma factor (sigma-70 family)
MQRTAGCRVRDALRNHRRFVGESASPGVIPERSRSAGPVTAEDRRRWLEELVARLPEKYAEVVRLCGFEELSCVEAASRLGLEPDTVRKRYEVARQALARRLGSAEGA